MCSHALIVIAVNLSVVGSAIAVTRLDKEVQRVTATYPEEDPITLADHMVRMCEEEVLDWMRTRTVHPGTDADPDPAGSLTGQKLVDETLSSREAERQLAAQGVNTRRQRAAVDRAAAREILLTWFETRARAAA